MTNEERELLKAKLKNKQNDAELDVPVRGAGRVKERKVKPKRQGKGFPKKFIIIGIVVVVLLLLGIFIFMAGSDSGSDFGKNKQNETTDTELMASAPSYSGFLSGYDWDGKHFSISYYDAKDENVIAKYDLVDYKSGVTKVLTFGDVVMTVYMGEEEPKIFKSIVEGDKKQWGFCNLPTGISSPAFMAIETEQKLFGLDEAYLSSASLVSSKMVNDVVYDILQCVDGENEYNYWVKRDDEKVVLIENYVMAGGRRVHEKVKVADVGRLELDSSIWDSREEKYQAFQENCFEIRNRLPVELQGFMFLLDNDNDVNMNDNSASESVVEESTESEL